MGIPEAPQPEIRLIGHSEVTVWGLTGAERLRRAVARVGLALGPETGPPANERPQILVRVDYIYDESLIRALAATPGCVLVAALESGRSRAVAVHVPAGTAVAGLDSLLLASESAESVLAATGLKVVDPTGLASAYNHALRKRAAPYLLSLADLPAAQIERRMFHGAYKGITDFVTKRVWPVPALAVTQACAKAGISPNAVTFVSLLAVLLAMWLFWTGQFGFGLCAAWMMCFLDTVDGKLARVTLTSTPWGNVFDHGIDLIHPPFWYYAWYHGLQLTGVGSAEFVALWIVILGYVGGRLQEGLFIWLFRIEIHTWRPVDSWFREITARRNPNLFILSIAILLGQPQQGFVAIAIWTVISFAFHSLRIVQAGIVSVGGRRPTSWLSEPAGMAKP
jgi:phosphatidylglycerophosphate synthase